MSLLGIQRGFFPLELPISLKKILPNGVSHIHNQIYSAGLLMILLKFNYGFVLDDKIE
jgi:hypothetical protein